MSPSLGGLQSPRPDWSGWAQRAQVCPLGRTQVLMGHWALLATVKLPPSARENTLGCQRSPRQGRGHCWGCLLGSYREGHVQGQSQAPAPGPPGWAELRPLHWAVPVTASRDFASLANRGSSVFLGELWAAGRPSDELPGLGRSEKGQPVPGRRSRGPRLVPGLWQRVWPGPTPASIFSSAEPGRASKHLPFLPARTAKDLQGHRVWKDCVCTHKMLFDVGKT